jgi:hypothetical protein
MGYTLPRGYLSPSAINKYLACPACYEAEYILNQPKKLGSALFLGGAVHKAVEHMRSAVLLARTYDFDDALQAAADYFDKETERSSDIELAKGYDSLGAVKDHAVELSSFVLQELCRLDGQRGLIAAELTVASSESLLEGAGSNSVCWNAFGFPFKARIDAVYGREDGTPTGYSDLKTTSSQRKPDFKATLQMWMYGQSLRPHALTGFVDQVGKTKTPTLRAYTLDQPGYGYQHEDPMYLLVTDVAEQISEGYFPPRPSENCDYDHGLPRFTLTIEDVEE